jgi:hypothetical protein
LPVPLLCLFSPEVQPVMCYQRFNCQAKLVKQSDRFDSEGCK